MSLSSPGRTGLGSHSGSQSAEMVGCDSCWVCVILLALSFCGLVSLLGRAGCLSAMSMAASLCCHENCGIVMLKDAQMRRGRVLMGSQETVRHE